MRLHPALALAALLPISCRRTTRAPPRPVAIPAIDVPRAPLDAVLVDAMPTTEPPPPPDDAPMEPGCFAWSPRLAAAACLVGQSGSNLDADTVWELRFPGEREGAPVSLVPVTDAGWFEEPHRAATPAGVRATLRARMLAGAYVDLRPLRRELFDAPDEWAPGATVRWVHRRTSGGGENAAARGTDRVELRWQPGGPRLLLTAWEDRPVAEPQMRAYAIPGGRYLVVEAVGRYGDEGEYGVHSLAWLCDREARACR
jgi:hypothetical protein